jgi:transcriptional regulator with XRE-family HTH domain
MATTASTIMPSDLVARMDRLGVTQEFLARYVGLSQPEVSKLVSGVRPQGEGHRKIADALRELEGISAIFAPLQPQFKSVSDVKSFLQNPRLPNLFALLTPAQVVNIPGQDLTNLNAISLRGDRMEQEIKESEIRTRDLWVEFFEEVSPR